MTCHEARELFSARIDERLTRAERLSLEHHIEGCADCRREWEHFSQTVTLLHSVREARAPAGFAARVIQGAAREPRHRRLLRRLFLPLGVKLPLEAAALVLLSTLVIFLYRQTPELQRAVEAPPAPGVTAPAPEPLAKTAEEKAREEPEAAMEKDRPGKKKEEAPSGEPPAVGGRMDAERAARQSAAPRSEPKLAARAQGPFHLVGLLKPLNREALDSQLGDLVKQVEGILVRDADQVGPGSIVEVIVPRDAYPRLEAGLRRLGDFRVETRASSFPERVRIAVRIAD